MRSKTLLIVLAGLFFFPHCRPSKSRIDQVVGTYRECLMGCEVIEIRPDHTFSYQPMSDVGEPEVFGGKWKFAADNILIVNTFEQPDTFPLKVSYDRTIEGVQVRITGEEGRPLPLAHIWLATDIDDFKKQTDNRGIAQFPKCKPSEMRVKSDFSQYTNSVVHFDLANQKGNLFEARISRYSYFITNERWLILDGELDILNHIPLKKQMK